MVKENIKGYQYKQELVPKKGNTISTIKSIQSKNTLLNSP